MSGRISTVRAATFAAAMMFCGANARGQAGSDEWRAYGHDALGSRYSPLAQITKENVASLAVAWTYRTGEIDAKTQQPLKFEATPLMVDGTLYLSTPLGKVIALDPTNGKARWTYDAHADAGGDWGDFASIQVDTPRFAKSPQSPPASACAS